MADGLAKEGVFLDSISFDVYCLIFLFLVLVVCFLAGLGLFIPALFLSNKIYCYKKRRKESICCLQAYVPFTRSLILV